MDPRTVAVFAPNLVGDTVMATPAMRALRTRFDGARLVLVIRRKIARVLEGAPWFDEVIEFDLSSKERHVRMMTVCTRLRSARPELAVLFPNSVRSALMAWLGGCRRRLGFDRGDRGWLLTDRLRFPTDARGERVPTPAVDSYLDLARHLGADARDARTQLFTTAADERAADAVWERLGLPERGRVVCLNNGGAFGPAKNWPETHFAQVARDLAQRFDAHVLVLCGPAERSTARAIVSLAKSERVVSLADEELGLGLSKACVRRATLLITTDSGPRHFAAAFGVPEITLFGPTHIEWTRTRHPRAVYMQIPLECGPCQKPTCPEGHHRCMVDLAPELVVGAIERLLRDLDGRAA